MLAVLATLTFLIAMWLCAAIVAGTLEQSGSRFIAALSGQSLLASPAIQPIKGRISQRYPSVMQRQTRAPAGLRAAA